MATERRLENKRTKITRKMEIACLDTGRYFIGETEDVSDSGIRACINSSPLPGASVMVRLFWDNTEVPVETFGRVAWASKLPVGEGIEVGLMLDAERDLYGKRKRGKRPPTRYHNLRGASGSILDDRHVQTTRECKLSMANCDWNASGSYSIENKKTLAAVVSPHRSRVVPVSSLVALAKGESFEVSYQGHRTWAKIETTGVIDGNGRLNLQLQIKNRRLWQQPSLIENGAPTESRGQAGCVWGSSHTANSNSGETRKSALAVAKRLFIHLRFKAEMPQDDSSGASINLRISVPHIIWKTIPLAGRTLLIQAFDTIRNCVYPEGHPQSSKHRRQSAMTNTGHTMRRKMTSEIHKHGNQ
ncbi:MAG: PilZ domain-containing protein [Deltaproteobacteria bacterium]|nr:PilZ domain-containing protein [Deltaproteobacteria bacterium]